MADKLRGVYKQSEYRRVILPFTVLRRLDCVLKPTKEAVLEKHAGLRGKIENVDPVLRAAAGQGFYNTSKLDFPRLLDDPPHLAGNLRGYIAGFSPDARDVIEKSSSTSRSRRSPRRTCSTWWCRSSRTSTCTPTGSRTSRWATCTRS